MGVTPTYVAVLLRHPINVHDIRPSLPHVHVLQPSNDNICCPGVYVRPKTVHVTLLLFPPVDD